MVTSDLSILVGSTELNQYGWNIAHGGWRMVTPPRRGDNLVRPYRHGRAWMAKKYDQRTLSLPMWVVGCEADGDFPTSKSQRDQLMENVRALRNLFRTDTVQTLTVYDPVLAKSIVADFEVVDSIDFETAAGITRAVFMVTMILPGIWFRDTAYLYDVASPTVRADAAAWAVVPATDAEICDPRITFYDGATNPMLTNLGDGSHWVKYNGTIAAGETVVIDGADFSAVSSVDGDVSNLLTWSSVRRDLFALVNGSQTLRYNGDTSCKVKVEWKGCYW